MNAWARCSAKLAEALAALPEWNTTRATTFYANWPQPKASSRPADQRHARAIVGQAVAPPLFETMVVLGQEAVVNRLRRAVEALGMR